MKLQSGIVVLGFAAAVAAFAPPAAAQDSGSGGSYSPQHSGFYFNADVGPANGYYHFTGPHDSMDTHAGGANLDLRFGYALTSHLILSGDLSGSATANNPDTTLDGFRIHSNSDYNFSEGLVGVGLTWYWDDNLFLGFTVGSGKIVQHFQNTDLNSDNGFASQVRFGKEWWVGDDWGLGIVGGVTYVSANADTRITVLDPYGNPRNAYFDHADATTGFVAFTATFN